MLRASCEANDIAADFSVVVDPKRSCDVRHYDLLIEFADALLARDETQLGKAREALRIGAGDAGVEKAAAVVGNFQMMNRALDTIGATFGKKLPTRVRAMAEEFGIEPPPHWPAAY